MSGLIQKFERPAAPNEFADAIKELIAAGEDAAWELVGPTTSPEGKRVANIETMKLKFQAAARDAGRSAREVLASRVVQADETRIVMVLSPVKGDESDEVADES